jgi:GNAT superfamily N-acetyltransferase
MHESIERLLDHDSYEGVFCDAPLTPIASFNRLVVAPRFRGLGLSRRLDIVRLKVAEEMGCRSAVVATPTGEKRIRQLESLGFVVVGHTSGFAGGPFAFRPIVSEAILVCSLPRRLSGASST